MSRKRKKEELKPKQPKVCMHCGGELIDDPGTVKTSKLLVHEENFLMKCPVGKTWVKERGSK